MTLWIYPGTDPLYHQKYASSVVSVTGPNGPFSIDVSPENRRPDFPSRFCFNLLSAMTGSDSRFSLSQTSILEPVSIVVAGRPVTLDAKKVVERCYGTGCASGEGEWPLEDLSGAGEGVELIGSLIRSGVDVIIWPVLANASGIDLLNPDRMIWEAGGGSTYSIPTTTEHQTNDGSRRWKTSSYEWVIVYLDVETCIQLVRHINSQQGTYGGYVTQVEADGGLRDEVIDIDIILAHELAHARFVVERNLPPGTAEAEYYAFRSENRYRDSRLLRRAPRAEVISSKDPKYREGAPIVALCRGDLVLPWSTDYTPLEYFGLPQIPQVGTSANCLVAESHPDGRDGESLNELRRLRERFLIGSGWGKSFLEQFHHHYYKFSGTIAQELTLDQEMRGAIGFAISAPIINYLRMVAASPRLDDSDLANLPSSVRKFLEGIYGDMEAWLAPTTIGDNPASSSAEAAAIEIAIALRFRCRRPDSAAKYLDALSSRHLIPLKGSSDELLRARASMRTLLSTDTEIDRVLGIGSTRGEDIDQSRLGTGSEITPP